MLEINFDKEKLDILGKIEISKEIRVWKRD
jgi:hypothetical protein